MSLDKLVEILASLLKLHKLVIVTGRLNKRKQICGSLAINHVMLGKTNGTLKITISVILLWYKITPIS